MAASAQRDREPPLVARGMAATRAHSATLPASPQKNPPFRMKQLHSPPHSIDHSPKNKLHIFDRGRRVPVLRLQAGGKLAHRGQRRPVGSQRLRG